MLFVPVYLHHLALRSDFFRKSLNVGSIPYVKEYNYEKHAEITPNLMPIPTLYGCALGKRL
jgi:hypothetical protein